MDIFAVLGLGLVGMILSITVKNSRPEMSVLVSLSVGIVILLYISGDIKTVFETFGSIIESSGLNTEYFKIAQKACIIAYITEFCAQLCRDAKEASVAVKLEMAGKVSIVILSLPVISGFLDAIGKLFDKI